MPTQERIAYFRIRTKVRHQRLLPLPLARKLDLQTKIIFISIFDSIFKEKLINKKLNKTLKQMSRLKPINKSPKKLKFQVYEREPMFHILKISHISIISEEIHV